MMMFTTSSRFLLFLSTLSVITVQEVYGIGNCTLCADGSPADLNPSFAFFPSNEVSCPELNEELRVINNFNTLSGSAQCKDLQLLAFQIGCCQHPPYYYCDICPDGSKFRRNNVIDIGVADNPTCGVYEVRASTYSGVWEHGTCNDTFLQRSAFYCGCPNVTQQCSLCVNNTEPGRPAKREKYISNSNCRSLNYLYSIFTEEECGTASDGFGVDMGAFCKCEGTEPYDICDLCDSDEEVKRSDLKKEYVDDVTGYTLSCEEALDYVQYITRDDVCVNFTDSPRFHCCTKKSDAAGVLGLRSLFMVVAGTTAFLALQLLL